MGTKKEKIDKFREFVNSPMSTGSAFAGLNLCDIYLNVKDREYVLDTIKYRFPDATANLDTSEEWFERLSSLKSKDSYINAFVGQAGEQKAIERLEELGKTAEMFESRTHPDNDLIDSDGIEWSVKSYAEDNMSSLNSEISKHPNSSNYIVNTEAYEKLKSTGKLDEYSDKGIEFIDGKFSHDEHFQLASERLNSVTGDITDEIYDGIWDDVPIVAGIVTICNIGINVAKYSKDEVNEKEATVDIMRSISKLTAASGGAAAGGVVGASIGSAIFPLVGTVIGGGVGSLLGAIGARGIVDDYINNFKFRSSNAAYEHFSNKYSNGLSDDMLSIIKSKFFYTDQIQKNLILEKQRFHNYNDELDLTKDIEPTISAVLIDETINKLTKAISKIETATKEIFDDLANFCVDYGIAKYPRERKKSNQFAKYLYGSIIAENSDWLLSLDAQDKIIIDDMTGELEKYPNNAFKLKVSKEKLLGALALLTLKNKRNDDE